MYILSIHLMHDVELYSQHYRELKSSGTIVRDFGTHLMEIPLLGSGEHRFKKYIYFIAVTYDNLVKLCRVLSQVSIPLESNLLFI